MAEPPPGTSCAKRTVSRYLTNGQRKGMPSNAVGEDEASSPQRPPRSSSRRVDTAPHAAASSPLWRVPWQPSPLANRTRTRSKASELATGVFSMLPEEVSLAAPLVSLSMGFTTGRQGLNFLQLRGGGMCILIGSAIDYRREGQCSRMATQKSSSMLQHSYMH